MCRDSDERGSEALIRNWSDNHAESRCKGKSRRTEWKEVNGKKVLPLENTGKLVRDGLDWKIGVNDGWTRTRRIGLRAETQMQDYLQRSLACYVIM